MKSNKKTNPIIQAARSHFDMLETKETVVDDWIVDDQPIVIYSTSPTLAEKSKIMKLSQGSDHALMAFTLIEKALTATGEKMFSIADKHALMNLVDPEIVSRVAYDLLGSYSIESMKKK